MISFECDYNNGAHPKILEHLIATNNQQNLTYGFDEWSESARKKIRKACGAPDAQIYFLTGGTQANMTVIDGVLDHYQAVIAAETGHINVHEAGAIEFTGHKVIALPGYNGKMKTEDLADYMHRFTNDESTEHLAQPGMVYITFPSEYGTLYSASEIEHIYNICHQYNLLLFIDGARLGYGLMSNETDVSLTFLASHCDVFYIGGTKQGALCGEAIVFPRENAPMHFFSIVKQHGALMAKGRVIGLQFDTLFTDNLYFEIAKHAIDMAKKMKNLFITKGLKFALESPTNQQFIILTNEQMHRLEKKVQFTHWEPTTNGGMICRFVTSWATTEKDLEILKEALDEYL